VQLGARYGPPEIARSGFPPPVPSSIHVPTSSGPRLTTHMAKHGASARKIAKKGSDAGTKHEKVE
jgi:hypothetical protein